MSADSPLPSSSATFVAAGIHRQPQPLADTSPDTPRAALAAATQITSSAPSRVNDLTPYS